MKISLNVGGVDRSIRVVVGLVLIGLGYSSLLTGGAAVAAYIAGAIAIITGVFRFCPAYMLLGIKTNSNDS